MFTWTDRPYESMWEHLRVLSHEDNVRRLLSGDLGRNRTVVITPSPILDKKAEQVAYCITQAYEYYSAADSITINTSPLLYFYGMLSLAKALIVANTPDKLLDDVRYHGLTYDKSGRGIELDKQTALVRPGVFEELTDLTCGFRYPQQSAICLKSILSISPEMAGMYELYYREPARLLYLYQVRTSANPYQIELSFVIPDPQVAYDRIPELSADFDLYPERIHGQALVFRSKDLRDAPDYLRIYKPVVGGQYVVGGLVYQHGDGQHKRYLSPPVSDYISMFILSDAVRYQQELWGSVARGKTTGILGLLTLLISISKRRYPNMILDALFGEQFEYGSPSRVM